MSSGQKIVQRRDQFIFAAVFLCDDHCSLEYLENWTKEETVADKN